MAPIACIHELFEEQARRTPLAIALQCNGETLNYEDLDRRASRLARYLRTVGVARETTVGICVERDFGVIVGILAILKAGGAYVPLDPTYPAERLSFLRHDAKIVALVTDRDLDPEWSDGCTIVDVRRERDAIDRESAESPVFEAVADNLAYIIYTSGSTGMPKGVMVTHRNVVRLFRETESSFGFNQHDTWLLFHSYAFDFSVWEMWGALLYGGRLLLIPHVVSRSPDEIVELIDTERVTVLNQTPSAFQSLIHAGARRQTPEGLGLRLVIFGGEALEFGALRPWFERHPEVRPQLVNMYGITETTVHVTYHPVSLSDVRDTPGTSRIGHAIPDLDAYVLDRQMSLAPIGVRGELYVGGAGLARGYWRRPGVTATRFVPDSISGLAGARLYRTGDQARWDEDGALEFLGRVDTQVKIRGYRIELGEIESALQTHASVRQAVVVVRADRADKRLVAYMLAADGDRCSPDVLRAHVRRQLPAHMVPAGYVWLDRLPLTVNGKVDRDALPEDVVDAVTDSVDGARDIEEELLAGIFGEVLRVPHVGRRDNFFELGGHSLLATQVMTRIRHVFGVEVPLRALFETPTVEGLAGTVRQPHAEEREPALPLAAMTRTGSQPVSYAQQRMWFVHQLDPMSPAYNIAFGLRMQGALDRLALEHALAEIVRRHDVLRTRFVVVDGIPTQMVEPGVTLSVTDVDLQQWDTRQQPAEVARYAAEAAAQPFDLQKAPLMRAWLLQLAENEHMLLVTLHHIVSDAWSLRILASEFTALYTAAALRQAPTVAPLPSQYADFAVWQRTWLQGERLRRRLAYWRTCLAGARPFGLPVDYTRPLVTSGRSGSVPVEIPIEIGSALKALSRRENVTLFTTLLAGFQRVLHRYTERADIAIAIVTGQRPLLETESLVGPFVNPILIRTNAGDDPTFAAVLRRLQQSLLDAYRHELPFDLVVEAVHPDRETEGQPLFEIAMVFLGTGEHELAAPGLELSLVQVPVSGSKQQLTFYVMDGERLSGSLTYDAELFAPATIERLAARCAAMFAAIATDPETSLHTVASVDRDEVAALRVEFSEDFH